MTPYEIYRVFMIILILLGTLYAIVVIMQARLKCEEAGLQPITTNWGTVCVPTVTPSRP